MSEDSQQAISHVLQQDSETLNTLLSKIAHLNALQQLLNTALGPKIAQHCQVAAFEKGNLMVFASSAAWATQLKFQSGEILGKLRKSPLLASLKAVVCKVRPVPNKPADKVNPPLTRLSNQASQSILDAAKTITDEKLKKILQRLAKHT